MGLHIKSNQQLGEVEKAFQLEQKEEFYVLDIYKDNMTKDEIHHFYESIGQIILSPKDVVVNCFYLDHVSFAKFFQLYLLYQQLTTSGNQIKFINMSDKLKDEMKLSVFSKDFFYSKTLCDAIKTFKSCLPDIESLSFSKALVLSVLKVMFIQAHVLSSRRKTFIKERNHDNFLGDIVAITEVKILDNSYVFALSFNEKVFIKILSELLGEDVKEVTNDNIDGVAEITSIVLGQTKNLLSYEEGEFSLSIPKVYKGSNYPEFKIDEKKFDWANSFSVVIPFATNMGLFNIELFFSNKYNHNEIFSLLFK